MAPTVWAATCASRAARNAGRCRWPLTRRNWLRASIMPAAHQRSAMVPFCQFFTLAERVRAIEIIDSMQLVERSVRARVGGTFRRSTVNVSARPSRRLPAAPGWVRSNSLASASSFASACSADSAVGRPDPAGDGGGEVIGQLVGHVADLVQLAAPDHRVLEHPHHGRAQGLAAVNADKDRTGRVQTALAQPGEQVGDHGGAPVSYTHLRAHEPDSYLVC